MKKHITFVEALIVLSLIVVLVKAGSYYRKSSKEGFDTQNSIDFRRNNTGKEEFAEIFESPDKQGTVKKARKIIKPEEVKSIYFKMVNYDNSEEVFAETTIKNPVIKKGFKLNLGDDPNFPRYFPPFKMLITLKAMDINNRTVIEIRRVQVLRVGEQNIDLNVTRYLDM
ncbi:MAG: hypothetical protein ABRQ38_15990 [Candidatus Eremiobacterota bacterium]